MSDPVRLVEGGRLGALGERVLASAAEGSPSGLQDRIHAAVVGGAAGAGLGAAGASTAAAATKTSAGVATAATKGSSWVAALSAAKLGGVVVVVAAGATVAVVETAHVRATPPVVVTPQETAPARARSSPAKERSAPRVAAASEAPPELAKVAPATPELAVPTVVPPPALAVPRAHPAADGAELAREVASIDAARAALTGGDLDGAIVALNRHDLAYPEGALRPEALAIRIEVYAARHDGARVKELGDRFLATFPGHPFAAKVPGLIEGTR